MKSALSNNQAMSSVKFYRSPQKHRFQESLLPTLPQPRFSFSGAKVVFILSRLSVTSFFQDFQLPLYLIHRNMFVLSEMFLLNAELVNKLIHYNLSNNCIHYLIQVNEVNAMSHTIPIRTIPNAEDISARSQS